MYGPINCRLEQLRAQRLQGDSVEQEALMTIAQNLAEQERTAAGNQGNKAKHKKGNKKAKVAESPPKEAPLKEGSLPSVLTWLVVYFPLRITWRLESNMRKTWKPNLYLG